MLHFNAFHQEEVAALKKCCVINDKMILVQESQFLVQIQKIAVYIPEKILCIRKGKFKLELISTEDAG